MISARFRLSLGLLLVACSPSSSSVPVSEGDTSPANFVSREAVRRAVPLLQSSQAHWTREVQCFSCHHQGLGALAIDYVRTSGFEVDEEVARSETLAIYEASRKRYEALLVCDGVGVFGRATTLIGLAAGDWPRDDVTDVLSHFLAARQVVSGGWYSNEHRPPFEDTHISATAWTVRALALYGPEGRAEELRGRLDQARDWLWNQRPANTEERSLRLLGLAWSGVPARALREAGAELLEQQREDGGWAQIETLASDAYATGQALVVLESLGFLDPEHPAWRRGTRYLREAQRPDGSWLVRTRRKIRGLKPRSSGFPYSQHQFVSFMGSAWATMALARDAGGSARAALFGPAPGRSPADDTGRIHGLTALHRAAAFGTRDELACEIERCLERCQEVDQRGPRGLTPLMLAVHDEHKVELLLQAGARPEATCEWGFSPLLMASITAGAGPALEQFLELRVDAQVRSINGAHPLVALASIGDVEHLQQLTAAGVAFHGTYLQQSLIYAATCNDVAMGQALWELGANPGRAAATFHTPLTSAVIAGYEEFVDWALAVGADLEATDETGMTALAWAAKVDPGHSRLVARLLAAGADPAHVSDNGWSPLDWAREHGNEHHLELLGQGP